MFSFSEFLGLLSLVLVILYWWHSQEVRQLALDATTTYCEQQGLQLLDQYIAFHRIWFRKDDRGIWRFWRSYRFEFTSTGNDRNTGQVYLLGKEILGFNLDVHRI